MKVVEVYDPVAGMAFTGRSEAILDYLFARGWDILLVAPSDPHQRDSISKTLRRVRTYDTRRQELSSPLAALFLFAGVRTYLRTFRAFRPDVVLVAPISPFLELETILAAKLLRLPIAFDIRDSWIILRAVHPGRIRNWIRLKMEGFFLRHGDLVFGVTNRQVAEMRRVYRIDEARSIAVYVGAPARIASAPPSAPQVDLIHAGPPRAYYDTGRLLDGIAILASRHKRLKVAFLGVKPEEGKSLREDLRARNLEGTVEVLPPVPREKVFDFLRTARIGILSISAQPTYRAAISTKSLDYIAAGLPVLYIGPSDSEQADFIRKFGIGSVVSAPKEFADVADRILSDPRLLRQLSEQALSTAPQMTWDVLLAPLETRLARIAESTKERGT